jgi:hypothetical protein
MTHPLSQAAALLLVIIFAAADRPIGDENSAVELIRGATFGVALAAWVLL